MRTLRPRSQRQSAGQSHDVATRRHASAGRRRLADRFLVVGILVAAITFVAVSSLFTEPVSARSTGIIDYSGNPDAGEGATCADCHGNNEPQPTITIDMPDSVVGGETILVSVTVSGGPGVEAGFNASFGDLAGEVDSLNNDTRTEADQVTHTSPKTLGVDGATFTFLWTAPNEAGVASIYAAGLSTNGNGNNQGDAVGTVVDTIEIVATTRLGDVNCSGELNVVDALVVAQFDAGVRTDAQRCPLNDPATEIVAANGDLNEDLRTDIIDALLIAQCDAGIDNGLCG
jgi:hypothetical protein